MVEVKMDSKLKRNPRNSKRKLKSRKKRFLKKHKEKVSSVDVTLHSDTYEYLVRMIDVIEKMRDDEYEMGVLAGNVFSEVKGKEVYFAKIRITSKLMEDLLPYSSDDDFTQFITPFVDNLRPVFTDRTASHILEAIAEELLRRSAKKGANDEKSHCHYSDTLLKISKFALNNFESFLTESSSNYILRSILNVLSGFNIKGEVIKDVEKKYLPSEYDSILEKFAQAFVNSPQLTESFCKSITSCLVQTLLLTTKHLESANTAIMKKIIKYCKGEPPDLKNEVSDPFWRLIEVALEVANEKHFKKIYKRLFKNDLKELSILRHTNFAVQKLIKNCQSKELFETIFNELTQFGEDILEARNTGILLELAQGCVKHKCNQGDYMKMMMRILKCQKVLNEDSDLALLTCSMVTSDRYNPEPFCINLHGTLIIQALLNFGKPIKIINGLLNMDTVMLVKLICDCKGCHIIDAFMTSQHVGEKSRDKLIKKLTGSFTTLATSKYGSRALEAIWNAASTKNRVLVMEELKQNESELTSNQFGKIFAYKTYLSAFRRNKEEWIKRERTLETTKRCFSDIIPAKKGKFDE